jgi:hypothetical protein
VKKTLELVEKPRVLSVGLGLGYNELLSFGRALSEGRSLQLVSFESESTLREAFLNWVLEHHSPEPWSSTYEKILQMISVEFQIIPSQLKQELAMAHADGRWELRSSLTGETEFPHPFHCILFDAFSSGATPELWTEDFLDSFLHKAADADCVFSTYAATGALKRALTKNSFQVDLRPGFAGKRQSTWAVRKL